MLQELERIGKKKQRGNHIFPTEYTLSCNLRHLQGTEKEGRGKQRRSNGNGRPEWGILTKLLVTQRKLTPSTFHSSGIGTTP